MSENTQLSHRVVRLLKVWKFETDIQPYSQQPSDFVSNVD